MGCGEGCEWEMGEWEMGRGVSGNGKGCEWDVVEGSIVYDGSV